MNVNKRDRREQAPSAERGAGQRTPRSGGRTVAERAGRVGAGDPVRGRGVRGSRERAYPTQGSAALRPEPRRWSDPAEDGRALRVWDSSDEPDQSTTSVGLVRESTGTPGEQAAAPRLRVAPPPPVAGPRVPFVALVLVLVVGGMLGILVVNSKVNENALRLENLQRRQASLDVQQQQLEQKIAEAEVPGNLTARARKLGLIESGPPAFIRLQDGSVIGVPQPADGAPAITSQQGTGE